MKTRYKILIPILSVVLLIGGFCGGVIINGSSPKGKLVSGNEDWMKYISDDKFINEIAIPGSHDSGTNKMNWLGETQNLTIKEQLYSGVRYFDLRVNKKSEDKYVIYHSIINGVEFEPIIKDIKEFIVTYPSETLLLDFQHFSNGSQDKVLSYINEYLYNDGLVIDNVYEESDLTFVSNLTLADTRGKCVIFWGNHNMSKNYSYLLSRNNDECEYSNRALDSYYDEDSHKNLSSKKFVNEYLPECFEKMEDKINNEIYKGIFVLQTQRTDGKLIFGPYSKDKYHHKNVTSYLNSLDGDYLRLVNVVMRDFINKSKCDDIIKLNLEKYNVKVELEGEFKNNYKL